MPKREKTSSSSGSKTTQLATLEKRAPREAREGSAKDRTLTLPLVLSHISASGEARMVGVADKPQTMRSAVARAQVNMSAKTAKLLSHGAPKGDVLAVARVAGIQGAKRTSELVPLCHPVALTKVDITIEARKRSVEIEARAEAVDRTGVEMEALTAVSVAALTVYDMLKAVERAIQFRVWLVSKEGGASGRWP